MTSFLSLVRELAKAERLAVLVQLRMAKLRLSRKPAKTIWGTLEPKHKRPLYARVKRYKPTRPTKF